VDLENMVFHFTGKSGRHRNVELPAEIAEQLNSSRQYLFNPGNSWKSAFYNAVREAARSLGVNVTGVRRLRATCLQNTYQKLIMKGLTDLQARKKLSHNAGHNRVKETYSNVPKRNAKQ
jgi:integrase